MQNWKQEFEKKGYKTGIADISHLSDLEAGYRQLKTEQPIAAGLRDWLDGYYDFTVPFPGFTVKSIIIAVSKSVLNTYSFAYRGKTAKLIQPPTYRDFISEAQTIQKTLSELTAAEGYRFAAADNLPNKMLAACCAVGSYGRNNLLYADGFGSFLLLTAFYSDAPAADSYWQAPKRLGACDTCDRCVTHCPSGAITDERRTIKSDRCLTTYNETKGIAFPGWMESFWHNSIVGCMKCQLACPINVPYAAATVERESFTEEDTDLILKSVEYALLPESLQEKLDNSNLKLYYDCLARNIEVLLTGL